jgi:BirA family biotin operon repressor/biotin-[acetyl-CoA-carboxylase] ligase
VLGLGLNVFMSENSASRIDQRWTDLHKAGQGRNLPSRNRLVSALINELMPLLESYPRQGLAGYIDEWRSYHSLEGRRVQIQQGAHILEGYINGISNQGYLKLVCLNGNIHEVASGDVRLRAMENV